jgi:hypothetical protein
MTIAEAIDITDKLTPNAYDETEKVRWLLTMAYQQQQDNISNLGNLYGLVSGADATDYERFLNNWNMNNTLDQQEYNKLIDKWNQDMQLSESNYNRRQDAQKLAQSQIDAIIAAGGTPSQALISTAGYDPSYINSLMSYYQQQAAAQTAARSGGSGGGGNRYPSGKDFKVNKDGSISVKKVRQLNFDPDEGIFTWNGNKYNSLNSLVDAWNKNSSLTDDDINVLKRKLKSQTNISL